MDDLAIVHGKPHGIASAPLTAMVEGCKKLGLRTQWLNPVAMTAADVRPCRFAAVVGHKKASYDVYREYVKRGIPILVCEYGYLKRGRGYSDYDGYYQLSWNGLNRLVPGPCPEDRFHQLGIPLVRERATSETQPVMVAGQVPNDAQHGMDMDQLANWYDTMCQSLRSYTRREIVYRPHPVLTVPCRYADKVVLPSQDNPRYALDKMWAVVTYNSNIGHEALLQGVPVFCDKSAVYRELANTNIAELENPARPARSQYFFRLAYSQWTLSEMESGEAIEYMLEVPHGIRD